MTTTTTSPRNDATCQVSNARFSPGCRLSPDRPPQFRARSCGYDYEEGCTAFHSIKLLGAGGFSTVDEVRHQQTGLRIVRKTLKNRNQTALDELKKEVNVLQKLRHPHIIRFLGAYSKGDKMSILISPVADTTLAVWLDRSALQKPANLFETIVKMFGCLASSVRYLHEQRPIIKHMDIKPQNILVVESDREFPHVILCDFGVSSAEEQSDEQSRPWTRQYIAPEVFEGFKRKQAADIWSLGCVFAEMASIPLSQDNAGWLAFNKAFSGRTGTYYWQDVPGVQKKLSSFLEEAKTSIEQVVVRTIQVMLSAQPEERPDASSLTMIFTPAPCCLNWPNDKTVFPSPHKELHEVGKFGKQHSIDSHAQPHLRDENASDRVTSIAVAKAWLDDCLCTHDACHHSSTDCFSDLPKRLIDILPEGQPGNYIRIVESDALETSTQYVALSHVWNHAEPVLSSGSLSKMQTELGMEALSVAVKNAISKVRLLGFRYCWLDSLCVLQDSMQEKEQECKSMSSVFRNAVLTVVLDQLASASTSMNVEHAIGSPGMISDTPLDFSTVSDINMSFPSQITPMTNRSTIATPSSASALLPADVLTAPNLGWDTRAWALQDRLLSRRFLHLGEQSYWECNTLKASETFPQGLPALLWEKTHTQCGSDELHAQNHFPGLDPSYRVRKGKTLTFSKTRSIRFDDTPLPLPMMASQPNANAVATSGLAGPHPSLPSASRLRNCQWIKKQGDDAGQGMEAVQATLDIHKPQCSMTYSDPDRCTCCSSRNRSRQGDVQEQGICRNANGNGRNANANANGKNENGNGNGNGRNESTSSAGEYPTMDEVAGLGYKGSGERIDDRCLGA